MGKTGWALAAAMLLAGAAPAMALTPTEIVQRHTASGGNVDAIMADYAEDAVVLQNGRAVQGKAEIRKLFEGMFARRGPSGSAGAARRRCGTAAGPVRRPGRLPYRGSGL